MTGINLSQAKHLIVAPALAAIGGVYDSPAALNLIVGIGSAETGWQYVRQLNDGPAYGFTQMEDTTHNDCWENFLNSPLQSVLSTAAYAALPMHSLATPDAMEWNLRYMVIMTRAQLRRARDPLPDANDAAGMSNYHKKWWNTSAGSADPAKNEALFRAAIAA